MQFHFKCADKSIMAFGAFFQEQIKICYHFKRFDLVIAVIIQFPNDTSQSAKCARILRPFRSNYLNAHSPSSNERLKCILS